MVVRIVERREQGSWWVNTSIGRLPVLHWPFIVGSTYRHQWGPRRTTKRPMWKNRFEMLRSMKYEADCRKATRVAVAWTLFVGERDDGCFQFRQGCDYHGICAVDGYWRDDDEFAAWGYRHIEKVDELVQGWR